MKDKQIPILLTLMLRWIDLLTVLSALLLSTHTLMLMDVDSPRLLLYALRWKAWGYIPKQTGQCRGWVWCPAFTRGVSSGSPHLAVLHLRMCSKSRDLGPSFCSTNPTEQFWGGSREDSSRQAVQYHIIVFSFRVVSVNGPYEGFLRKCFEHWKL